jgi:hypothetical protein
VVVFSCRKDLNYLPTAVGRIPLPREIPQRQLRDVSDPLYHHAALKLFRARDSRSEVSLKVVRARVRNVVVFSCRKDLNYLPTAVGRIYRAVDVVAGGLLTTVSFTSDGYCRE